MLPRLAAVLSTAALVGAGLVSAAPAHAAADAGEVLTVTIRNLGKEKSASIAVGNLPGC